MQAFQSWLFAFVTPYLYNVGAGSADLGARTGWVFAGTSVLLWVAAWWLVPETRGLSIEVMDGLYERRVSPRFFGRSHLCVKGEERGVELQVM